MSGGKNRLAAVVISRIPWFVGNFPLDKIGPNVVLRNMFEDCSGRTVKSLGDAECYVLSFIVENLAQHDRRVADRSQDFDLYLPWLMEIIENHHIKDEAGVPDIVMLERLYMDAAWSLVMKGKLRPGPRTTSSDVSKNAYGKGFSLTMEGTADLSQRIRAREFEIRELESSQV